MSPGPEGEKNSTRSLADASRWPDDDPRIMLEVFAKVSSEFGAHLFLLPPRLSLVAQRRATPLLRCD